MTLCSIPVGISPRASSTGASAGTITVSQADIQPASEADEAMQEEEEEQSGEAAIQAVLTGAIAKVVYRNAIQAVPDSIDFRNGFLKLLAQFNFEGLGSIQQSVLDSIQHDFGDTEQAWDLQARAASDGPASSSQVC